MHLTSPTPLTPPYTNADILDIARVEASTLTSSPLTVLRFGRVPEGDAVEWLERSVRVGLAEGVGWGRIADPEEQGPGTGEHRRKVEQVVVRDLDLGRGENEEGRIVAHAEWRYNPASSLESDSTMTQSSSTEPASLPPPPSANTALIKHFNSLVESALATHFAGPPTYELRALSTISTHLRRGIARQLVTWIFPFADRDGLPVVLAASPPGRGLYASCGFEELVDAEAQVVAVRLDMGEWGGEGLHEHVLMVRWPEGKNAGEGGWEGYRQGKRNGRRG